MLRRVLIVVCLCTIATVTLGSQAPSGKVTAIRAGRLVDPETGTAAANQVILVEGERSRHRHPTRRPVLGMAEQAVWCEPVSGGQGP